MTWNYASPIDTLPAAELPTEWIWERLLNRRNQLLVDSDVNVTSDTPGDVDAWRDYRQALRDLPANTTDPREAVWPTPPQSTTRNPNRTAIEDAARQALADNRSYLAIASPTQAQAGAQVKALTRQVNGVIRLLLSQLDGLD
jgi:hypothetical protein